MIAAGGGAAVAVDLRSRRGPNTPTPGGAPLGLTLPAGGGAPPPPPRARRGARTLKENCDATPQERTRTGDSRNGAHAAAAAVRVGVDLRVRPRVPDVAGADERGARRRACGSPAGPNRRERAGARPLVH